MQSIFVAHFIMINEDMWVACKLCLCDKENV